MHFFRTCAFKGIIAKGASVQGTFPPEILVGERVNIEVVHAVISPVHELIYNLYPFTYSGRPSNSHGLTVTLTVWDAISRSHGFAFKSHGEPKTSKLSKKE